MNQLLEKHPGELLALAFVAMGVAFVIGAVVVEMIGPIAGQTFGGPLLDGANWQQGLFPAP